MRYIYRNITPLNLILLAVLVVVGLSVLLPLARMKVRYTPPPAKVKAAEAEEKAAEASNPSPADYALIADQNLFHPDRIVPVDKKTELPKPELTLFGTMVADGVSYAIVENKKSPQSSPGRGKRQTVLKKSDSVSGFVVTEIEADRIVLVRGDEKLTVYLAEGEKRLVAAAPSPPPKTPSHGTAQPATPATPPAPRVLPPAPKGGTTGSPGQGPAAVRGQADGTEGRVRSRTLTGPRR